MRDPQDKVDFQHSQPIGRATDKDSPAGPARRFLSIWFRCCHTYGRLYRNRDETAYEGRCPRCGAAVHALIGEGGTRRRMFEAG